MPIYEYRCKSCTRRFELLRSFGQKDSEAACPECGSGETQRQLSVIAATIPSDSGACGWDAAAGACARPG